jgi:hypothetical protein
MKIVERLAAHARLETLPSVDVANRVVARLRQVAPPSVWPLALFVSATAVAAVLILIISMPLFDLFTDPWSACFASTVGILL